MNYHIKLANSDCYNVESDGQYIGYIRKVWFSRTDRPAWKPDSEMLRWFGNRGIIPPAYWVSLTELGDWMKGQNP